MIGQKVEIISFAHGYTCAIAHDKDKDSIVFVRLEATITIGDLAVSLVFGEDGEYMELSGDIIGLLSPLSNPDRCIKTIWDDQLVGVDQWQKLAKERLDCQQSEIDKTVKIIKKFIEGGVKVRHALEQRHSCNPENRQGLH
jgi:hypothetical protein